MANRCCGWRIGARGPVGTGCALVARRARAGGVPVRGRGSVAVPAGVFGFRQELQIAQDVVRLVLVPVVDVVVIGDRPVGGFPDVAVEIPPLAVGAGVVPVPPAGVSPPLEHDVGERVGAVAVGAPPLGEHLVHALPGDAEGGGDLG